MQNNKIEFGQLKKNNPAYEKRWQLCILPQYLAKLTQFIRQEDSRNFCGMSL